MLEARCMNIPWTKLPFAFDPAPLQREVFALAPDSWVPHFNAADYAGEWSSVSLRSTSGRADDILPGVSGTESSVFYDTPLLAANRHLRAVVETFQFPLKAVRLLRLHGGSRVKEHSDGDLRLANGEIRVHVPILTSDRVEFIVSNRQIPLRAGESWFIDFSKPHRIHNAGAAPRIHLVIDGTLNGWAADLLERSCREIESPTFVPAGVQAFDRFRELVYRDPALQADLMAKQSAPDLLNAVVAAGERFGFLFTFADVQSLTAAHHREWTMRSTV